MLRCYPLKLKLCCYCHFFVFTLCCNTIFVMFQQCSSFASLYFELSMLFSLCSNYAAMLHFLCSSCHFFPAAPSMQGPDTKNKKHTFPWYYLQTIVFFNILNIYTIFFIKQVHNFTFLNIFSNKNTPK